MSIRNKSALSLAAVGLAAGSAAADRVDLIVYENASGTAALIDMWVDVVAAAGTVSFTFHNDSAPNPSVTAIYFEDTAFFGGLSGGAISGFTGANVSFSDPAVPATPAATTSVGGPWAGTGLGFDADPPPSMTGIDTSETLTISFANDALYTTAEIVAALDSGEWRIAQHVQGVGPDGANSLWTISVPTPATVALLGFGGLAATRRRR